MGGEQISSEFEYSASFLKILMPGIIISTLASFLLILNYPQYISFFKELITKSVWAILPLGGIFLTVSIIVGLIVSILTNTLTMVLEGYYLEKYNKNFFVRPVRGFLHKRQWEMFDKYRSNYAYTYLFSWDKNPRKVNRKLMEFLKQSFGLDWVKTAKIEKIDDGMALRFFTEKNSLSLRINDAKTKLNLIIDDGRTYEFIIKSENNKLNIYTKTEGVERELIYRDLYYYFSNCLYESYKDSNINKAIVTRITSGNN